MVLAFIEDDDKRNRFMFTGMLGTMPTLCIGLMMALVKIKLIFVDLFGIVYLIGTVLSLVTLFLTDWINISP